MNTTLLLVLLLLSFAHIIAAGEDFSIQDDEDDDGSTNGEEEVVVEEEQEKEKKGPPPDFDFSKFGDFGGLGGNKPCPAYRCSSGMTPIPKTRQKYTSTGCSGMNSGGMLMMAGGDSPDLVYESCCDQWHACYQICGISKKTCDETFKTCADKLCADDEDCTRQVGLNMMLMNLGGCQKFDQAQYAACDCIDKKKATEKRESTIRRFYKKYAPDKEENAKSLSKKATTASKLAGLLQKLLLKYPEAIQKVEDPQQAAYRKMMEDAKNKAAEGDDSTTTSEEEEQAESEDVHEL